MRRSLLVILLVFIAKIAVSQVIEFDHSVKFNEQKKTADIKIIIHKGEPEFTYFLLKNDFKGVIVKSSTLTQRTKYVFKDVPVGKYFIKIEDKYKRPAGISVIVGKNYQL